MKRTLVDPSGDVRCPHCGARNAFTSKRTGKAKVVGVATVGVGAVAVPKRLQCQGCGAYLKTGGQAARGGSQLPPMSTRTKLIIWAVILVVVLISLLTSH